jgi:hypothetical protein
VRETVSVVDAVYDAVVVGVNVAVSVATDVVDTDTVDVLVSDGDGP